MGWRTVVITKPAKLDLKLGYLSIRNSDSNVKIHISEISVLMIETVSCSVTSALLNELIKQKIKVIFCDEKRNPASELLPYYGSFDCSLKLKMQIQWDEQTKQMIWTCIVAQKIKNQADNLDFFELPESKKLYQYIDELEFNDETNREGHAAKVYFNSLFGKDFSRSSENPTNAALNYGYSILLACFNREIVCGGYSTKLGLFHNNMFNSFNLSCDLMEPFRPIVDRFIKLNLPKDFDHQEKMDILSLLSSEFIIDERKQTLLNTIKIYTKSVLDAIEEKDPSLIKFYRYEL